MKRKEPGYWNSKENQRLFLETVAKKFNIHSPLEWSKVRVHQIYALGGTSLLCKHNGNLLSALKYSFPGLEFPILCN